MDKKNEQEKITKLEQQSLILSGAMRQVSLVKKRYQDALALLQKKDKELKAIHKDHMEIRQQLIEKESMAALGSLVAGVAHEVNTPIGVAITSNSVAIDVCKGLKESYRADALSEEEIVQFFENIEESNQIVEQSLQRAAKLIRSFKRISVDQSCDDLIGINLYEYLKDIIRTFHNQFKNRPIEITLDCPQELMIETYPGALAQIMGNLLQNSLNYAFKDNKKGTIEIYVEPPKKDKIKIVFADDGIGMDEDLRQHAFEPFVTMHRGQGGSGLGLNIVYNLITQKLNGNITLESSPGKGASFSFIIPVNSSTHHD